MKKIFIIGGSLVAASVLIGLIGLKVIKSKTVKAIVTETGVSKNDAKKMLKDIKALTRKVNKSGATSEQLEQAILELSRKVG
jgi:ABC-type proline/glycine betaine transport system substrate-binding protein